MSRYVLILDTQADRERAAHWVRHARPGTAVEFRGQARSLDQNRRMWALLSIISRELLWHGQYFSPEDWKFFFTHAWKGERWMPAEGSGMVPIGRSTSKLTVTEHSELMTVIEAFAARQGIQL